ncbi:MAG: 2OG-Fe(II) oxygenase [Pegethrix bostrychoides GSE-TBD4-15B]|jgi:predicted 2-oxoglutarate/Fe(II)-dependent dioxygenase YbiX|uniref:2OG-Fe(II) oxygenase n=1 Tax=Pegethrix bostrychoides GSE-TBD4-15B TaxID=2839662 RepID=A0A951PCT0_9CYAN|nr:2OG-Fe(II) oxygenase [Pegethrix bostrychoides GSE-TBD4-15B]
MSSYSVVPLGEEIFLVKALIEPELCQKLMALIQQQRQQASILLETVDNQVRSGDMLRLGGDSPELTHANQLLIERFAVIQHMLVQVYGIKFPYAEPCTLLRYQPGQFYKRHIDNILLGSRFEELEQGLPCRDVSIVGYLNGEFEGGETYFDRQDVKVRPEAGAVLVFPASFTHPHESLPLRQGEKYAFTSWLFH